MARQKGRLVLDVKGVGELLRDPGVEDALQQTGREFAQRATSIARSAGHAEATFGIRTFQGRDRVRVHVGTMNVPAILAEQRDRALARARGWNA